MTAAARLAGWLRARWGASPAARTERAGHTLRERRPPPGLQPTVEWQVLGRCNYDCSYCIQSRASRRGVPSRQRVERIVAGLAGLTGVWEIKISGGEPLAWRGLVQWVVPQLVRSTRHNISILTNLSASLATLERFCRLTNERLRTTSASLHPEFTSLERFVARAGAYRELCARHNPHASLVINAVLVPGRLEQHQPIRDRLAREGLSYFPQLMKIRGGIYPYSPREWRAIEELIGGSRDPRRVNLAPSYQGRHCEAGVWYFVLDQHGEAYSCRTAKRFVEEDDRGRLGSLVDGSFALRAAGEACRFSICPCTVPANRGIVRPPAVEVRGGS